VKETARPPVSVVENYSGFCDVEWAAGIIN